MKEKDMKFHWVVHSKIKRIGVDGSFNKKIIINELKFILNNNGEIEKDASVNTKIKKKEV